LSLDDNDNNNNDRRRLNVKNIEFRFVKDEYDDDIEFNSNSRCGGCPIDCFHLSDVRKDEEFMQCYDKYYYSRSNNNNNKG